MPIQKDKFKGFEPASEQVNGGKQKKSPSTGVYKDKISGKQYYIKASSQYPADDMADVTASLFQIALIGEQQAIRYHFIKNIHENVNYVYSEVRKDSQKLSEKNVNYRNFLKGWKGCTPTTDETRDLIYTQCFANKPNAIRDMAKILVGSIINLDLDCQLDNIVEYSDETGSRRLAKFDNGWALAGICKDKHKIIRLLDNKNMLGKKATHIDGLSPLPANHYGFDYPKIINSKEFLEEIGLVTQNLGKLINSVDVALNKITEKHTLGDEKETERLRLRALQIYAQHIGYAATATKTADKLKNDIAQALKSRFIERIQSLQVVKSLLQINMLKGELKDFLKNPIKQNKLASKKILSPRLVRKMSVIIAKFVNTIKKNYAGQKVGDFMPNFEPTVNSLIDTLVQHSRLCNKQSKISSGIIDKEWLSFLESLKNNETVIPGTKASQDQILQMYDAKQKKGKETNHHNTLVVHGKQDKSNFKTCEQSSFITPTFNKEIRSKSLPKPLSALEIWESCDPAKNISAKSLGSPQHKWAERKDIQGLRTQKGPDALKSLDARLRQSRKRTPMSH